MEVELGGIAEEVLGNRFLAETYTSCTARRLRVLAYHDVDDVRSFGVQMDWLAHHSQPISFDDVVAGIERGVMPRRAVWVTFDDGHPGVVESAQSVLDHNGIRATLFVCPGLVGTADPFWWQVVEQALAAGLRPSVSGRDWNTSALVTHLKTVPDSVRRGVVEELAAAVEVATGRAPTCSQLTKAQLRSWTAAGHTVGNHSWDHPCLDRCSPDEQTVQLTKADGWLRELAPDAPRVFAYPNGDRTDEAEATLATLGYEVATLFDHRLTRARPVPLRVSRLRVSAGAPLARFRAVVSGVHSAMFGLRASARSGVGS